MKAGATAGKRTRLSPTTWALIIFSAAFLVRLLHLLGYYATPLFKYLTSDSLFYYQVATEIANGHAVGDMILLKAPLYPYLLATFITIFGPNPLSPLLFQNIVGAFACVMIYLIARKYYSNRVAVTAGLAAAVYGTLIFFDNELVPFSLALTLNLVALWQLTLFESDRARKRLIISGLLVGLSAVLNPAILLFAVVVVFWLHQRVSENRKQWLQQLIPFLIGILIFLVPAAARNAFSGEALLFKTYAGVNFAADNNPQAKGGAPVFAADSGGVGQGLEAAATIASKQAGTKLTTSESGSYWFKEGIGYVFSHPISWLGLEVRKAANLVSGYELPKDRQVYFSAERSGVLKFFLWDKILAFPFGLILPFALLAPLAAAPLRKDKRQCVIIGYVLSFGIMMLLFTVTARYRAIVVPIILIWAAAGFWALVRKYQEKDFKSFYKQLTIFAVALVICNGLAYIPQLTQRGESEFEGYLFTGSAYLGSGQYADAEQEFFQAVTLNPRSPAGFINLGLTYEKMGKDSSAAEFYKRAVAADPSSELAKRSLAGVYHRRDRIKELADLVVAEIKKNPRAAWAYIEYGYVHEVLKEYSIAVEQYELAFQADSTNPEPIFLEANCFLNADMRLEAAEQYQRFLKYVPNSIEAHANLGQIYARQNKLDQALSQFQMVANAQPNNPAGYFNLASLNLQMGNFDKAEELLNRTVALDPQFPGIDQLRQMIESEKRATKEN